MLLEILQLKLIQVVQDALIVLYCIFLLEIISFLFVKWLLGEEGSIVFALKLLKFWK